MRLKLRPRYVLAFAVRGKRKVGSLYSPTKGGYADYHEVQPIWIADLGPECRIRAEGVTVGCKGFILDVYELEDLPVKVWESYAQVLPKLVVDDILDEVQATDGILTANVLHEDSIFAVEA